MRTNFVGRSFVSAITHTPASGPFGPVTTPPMSVGPTSTASRDIGRAAATIATHAAARPPIPNVLILVTAPPFDRVRRDRPTSTSAVETCLPIWYEGTVPPPDPRRSGLPGESVERQRFRDRPETA